MHITHIKKNQIKKKTLVLYNIGSDEQDFFRLFFYFRVFFVVLSLGWFLYVLEKKKKLQVLISIELPASIIYKGRERKSRNETKKEKENKYIDACSSPVTHKPS